MKTNPKLESWLESETELLSDVEPTDAELADACGADSLEIKKDARHYLRELLAIRPEAELEQKELDIFKRLYRLLAALALLALCAVLVFTVSYLPPFGAANEPASNEVYTRYTESGLSETGAVNIVAGVILDYRAFDTLGESNVLFCAVSCVFILLQNRKNHDYIPDETAEAERFDITADPLLKNVVKMLFPLIALFGLYIMLCGHLGAGGGFAGGAVLGGGLILYTLAFGEQSVSRFFNRRVFRAVTLSALSFYCLSKSYSFFTGANGIESIIPKGTAGNILSAGLILPLNIAVGLVVSATIFGFYSVFQKGEL